MNENPNEILVRIEFQDGEILDKEFNDFCEADRWERITRHYHKNRRAKKDRRNIRRAFLVGWTIRAENVLPYSNLLHGVEDDKYALESLLIEWKHKLKKRGFSFGKK